MADIPCPADFTDPGEVLARVTEGQQPDSCGRVQFTAFWVDQQCPGGVRGQVFNTSLATFTAREKRDGYPVRVIA